MNVRINYAGDVLAGFLGGLNHPSTGPMTSQSTDFVGQNLVADKLAHALLFDLLTMLDTMAERAYGRERDRQRQAPRGQGPPMLLWEASQWAQRRRDELLRAIAASIPLAERIEAGGAVLGQHFEYWPFTVTEEDCRREMSILAQVFQPRRPGVDYSQVMEQVYGLLGLAGLSPSCQRAWKIERGLATAAGEDITAVYQAWLEYAGSLQPALLARHGGSVPADKLIPPVPRG